jgi:hypothetical protein
LTLNAGARARLRSGLLQAEIHFKTGGLALRSRHPAFQRLKRRIFPRHGLFSRDSCRLGQIQFFSPGNNVSRPETLFYGVTQCSTAFFIVSRPGRLKKPVKQCCT